MTQSSCLDDLGEYALGDLVSPLWLLVFVVVVAVLGAAVVVAVSVAVVVAVMGLLCFILFGDTKGDVDDDDPTPLNTFNEARRTDAAPSNSVSQVTQAQQTQQAQHHRLPHTS